MSCASIFAQSSAQAQDFDLQDALSRDRLQGLTQPQTVALESTIDPANYFVGPSDVFSVIFPVTPPGVITATVTPEGTLIIPTVGEVYVADMTLQKAKAKVLSKIKSKYISGGEVGLTLVTPRPVVVMVRGNVLNPGSLVLWAYNRADKAIDEANKVLVWQTKEDLQAILQTMSTRNISIRHKDGSMSPVDITKFLATKDDRLNPYLREGDVIIVPRKDLTRNVIGVYGEVNVPGRYEYAQGDSIKDALSIAQGFTSLALSDSVEFSRLDPTGEKMFTRILDGWAILEGRAPDLPLEPGDRLVVRTRPDLRADYNVTLVGEIVFPGTYPITKNRTRLSEIVGKAGGFTEFASIGTAHLLRKPVLPGDIELERLESARGGVSPSDSAYYHLETNLRIQKEAVNVDFARLFVEKDTSQDAVLRDGDVIMVPSIRNTIYVFGQVATPGHIPFLSGEDAEYYIGKAGGFTSRARTGDVMIVKAKSRQWLSPDETVIEEGDYVWAPLEIEHPFSYYMSIIGQTASILSVAVSVVLLVNQINK